MSHEHETLEAVISARNVAKSARKASRKLESFDSLTLDHLKWGLQEDGHQIGKSKPVFPRIVVEEVE